MAAASALHSMGVVVEVKAMVPPAAEFDFASFWLHMQASHTAQGVLRHVHACVMITPCAAVRQRLRCLLLDPLHLCSARQTAQCFTCFLS